MFKFTEDKINLFMQSYVHNNKNTSIINFVKLIFKNKFINFKELQKKKELEKEKQKKQEKQLQDLIKNNQNIVLKILNKKNYISRLKLTYIYKKLSKIYILNKFETQKKFFENNLTLNNTTLYL